MKSIKLKSLLIEFFIAGLSVMITFALMINSGIDLSQANIFSFDTFSIYVFALIAICLHFFRKMLTNLTKLISIFVTSQGSEKN
ncbi:hypothetical protein LMJ53_10000 [Rheinheimera sp. UJ51]|uniref:hypothetical protein n=1 Tax=Rheinheimera sp. UJ51 TaxID=2892446 RepID=UPI001E32D127|nr:hypothetical protein [Rheinheimera sp. UJ51]MCC5452050.1 hypothetical protein [Rheinheimera sp. UJ51]